MGGCHYYPTFDSIGEFMGAKASVNVGESYNFLTVCELGIFKNKGTTMHQCKCKCGQMVAASSLELVKGYRKSCGCLRKKGNRTTLDETNS